MAQSGFEDKRGLAYPPNIEPNLEPWMERVRVTLGKLLDASVDAARINTVTLDVDELGNVTAQVTPNENTKWIEYYGLTTLYPTISEIVTSGTEVRVWDTPGETYTTGTLITLTDGQTYFFGAVAYEEEDATMTAPALSTSVPVYAEITYSAATSDTDTIVPTVGEVVTYSGTQGIVTLTINDPGDYVNATEFATYTGGVWNSPVLDESVPYDLDETVTMNELHNVGIRWGVRYDLGNGDGDKWIRNVVIFDIDVNPELSEGYLTVDTTDGDVIYRYVGDDDTLSVAYATSATDWTTDALAKTAAEAGTPIDGRTGPATGGTVVYAGLAEGATRFFAVSANDAANATGNFGSQIYRYQITRPTDTTTDTDTIPPRVVGDVTYDGSGNATLSLLVSWGTYSTGTVEFKAKSGEAAWEVAWTEDTTSPFEHSVVLDEKHDSHIKYLVTYGSSLTIGDIVTIDIDNAPELQTASVTVNDSGDARLTWAGDDDVDYIKWKVFTGANLDDTDYPAWTGPGDGGTRSPTSGDARNYEVVVATGMTEGHDCLVSFYCFNTVTGNNSLILYKVRDSYPTDTDTHNQRIPIVTPKFDDTQVELVIDDPDSRVSSIWFNKYEDLSWGGWVEDTTYPYISTVTLSPKHVTYIVWKVGYDSDSLWIWGSGTWDIDTLPEWNNVELSVDASGDCWLNWVGDDDVKYMRWKVSTSDYPTWTGGDPPTDPDLEGTREPPAGESRSGRVEVYSALAEGATCFATYYGFVSDGNTWTPHIGKSQITRPTDTTTDTDTIVPTVKEVVTTTSSTGTVTLTVNNPDGYTLSYWFREKVGTGSWTSWYEDSSAPYANSVSLSEKHNSYIGWRVRYNLNDGGGDKDIERTVTFDVDTLPELTAFNCYVTTNGNPLLSWTGDDDVGSIRYDLNQGSAPSWPTLANVQAGTYLTGRTGEGVDIGGVTSGNQWRLGVLAYTGTAGDGTESVEMYQIGGKHYKDTLPPDTPGVPGLTISMGEDGQYTVLWTGDTLVASVRVAGSNSGYPTETTTRAATVRTGQAGETPVIGTAVAGGIAYVTAFAYTDAAGTTGESALAKASMVYWRAGEIGGEQSIIKSDTAPGSPSLNDLWIDTAVPGDAPAVLMRYNGASWEEVAFLNQGFLSTLDEADTAQIATKAITTTKIDDLAVDTPQLNAGAVTAAKIEAGTITANEIYGSTLDVISADVGTLTAGEIRDTGSNAIIKFGGTEPTTYGRYIWLPATSAGTYFIKHPKFTLEGDGSAEFKGDLTADAVAVGTGTYTQMHLTQAAAGSQIRMETEAGTSEYMDIKVSSPGSYASLTFRDNNVISYLIMTNGLVTIGGGTGHDVTIRGGPSDLVKVTAPFQVAADDTNIGLQVDTNESVLIGAGLSSTSRTTSMLFAPIAAGIPTGAAFASNRSPILTDTTNSRLYVRVGSTWKYVSLT